MERIFNYQWGSMDGEASRIFPSTDIRCGDSDLKDFTLRASNLKEAVEMVKKGGFAVVPHDATKFTASGCPPFWPHSTKGLVKASQRGGGGEDDSTTFHRRDPWKVVFMQEGKKVEWHLVKIAQPLSVANVRDGKNESNPSNDNGEAMLIPCPGAKATAVINLCKGKRKKRMTAAKALQLSNRSLFRAECKKKRKRGRRKSKGEKAQRDSDARKKVDRKRVGSKKYQEKVVPRDSLEQKAKSSQDHDLDAKVCDHCHRFLVFSLVCLSL